MPRGNSKNLKVPTSEQARKNGAKGGKASAASKKAKKDLKKCIEALLEAEITDENGQTMTGAEVICARLYKAAQNGSIKAFEVLRDTVGQKPTERIFMTEVDPEIIKEIEKMVLNNE